MSEPVTGDKKRNRVSLREYHRILRALPVILSDVLVLMRSRSIASDAVVIRGDVRSRSIVVLAKPTPARTPDLTIQFRWVGDAFGFEKAGLWYINGSHTWGNLPYRIKKAYREAIETKLVL